MRQNREKRYLVPEPEDLKALYALHPEGNGSVLMLAQAWNAEKMRRASHGIPRVVVVTCVSFETGTRRCIVKRQKPNGNFDPVGRTLPYNEALRFCQTRAMTLMEPEDRR